MRKSGPDIALTRLRDTGFVEGWFEQRAQRSQRRAEGWWKSKSKSRGAVQVESRSATALLLYRSLVCALLFILLRLFPCWKVTDSLLHVELAGPLAADH